MAAPSVGQLLLAANPFGTRVVDRLVLAAAIDQQPVVTQGDSGEIIDVRGSPPTVSDDFAVGAEVKGVIVKE